MASTPEPPVVGAPAADALLDAWDAGASQPPAVRALLLLVAAAGPAAGDVPPGERDRLLLELRRLLFGSSIACGADCPACGAALELDVPVEQILHPRPAELHPRMTMRTRGRELSFRGPTAAEVAASARLEDAGQRRRALLRACLDDDAVGDLTPAAVRRIERRIVAADPQAEIELALVCPDCEAEWEAPFDIADVLWAEVDAWARRLLWDVHELACAYGWTEADVLALPAVRRDFYLTAVLN
jgi:hypothetical protein